jgi:hypothetical protein
MPLCCKANAASRLKSAVSARPKDDVGTPSRLVGVKKPPMNPMP